MSVHFSNVESSERKRRSNDSEPEADESHISKLSDEPNFGMIYSSAKNPKLLRRLESYLKKNQSSVSC